MIQSPKLKDQFIVILKASTIFVFLGRAYQHIVWDAPYRTFLWDEAILKGLVEKIFNITWNEYVTNLSIANNISVSIQVIGICYLLCALAVPFIKSSTKKAGKIVLLGGAIGLFILALLYCKEKFFHLGQFFEYACQVISPILLYMMMFTSIEFKKIRITALVAIALTFSCHGLYAIGYYPRPGNFIDMTLNTLPIEESSAHLLLKIAGILDFIIAIAIFIPKTARIALIYAFIWGGLTALARLTGHFHADFLANTFDQWTWEVLIRLPHALIPLFIILADQSEQSWLKNTFRKKRTSSIISSTMLQKK